MAFRQGRTFYTFTATVLDFPAYYSIEEVLEEWEKSAMAYQRAAKESASLLRMLISPFFNEVHARDQITEDVKHFTSLKRVYQHLEKVTEEYGVKDKLHPYPTFTYRMRTYEFYQVHHRLEDEKSNHFVRWRVLPSLME